MSDRIIVPGAADSIIRGSGVWNQSGYFAGRYGAAGSGFLPWQIVRHGSGYAVSGSLYIGGLPYIGVLKLSSNGAVVWARVLKDGANPSAGYAIAVDSAGNIGVVGINRVLSVPQDFTVAKFSSAGALLWVNTYTNAPLSGLLQPGGVTFDSAGNLYAAATNNGIDNAIMKFNSAGVLQWQENPVWVSGAANWAAMAVNAAGSIVYAVTTFGLLGLSTATGARVQTISYNPSVPLNNVAFRSVKLSGNNAYLSGYSTSGGALGFGMVTAAIDLTGPSLIWDRHIGAFTNIGGNFLDYWQTDVYSGSVFTVGNFITGAPTLKVFPAAFNANTGALQWLRQIDYAAGGLDVFGSGLSAGIDGLALGYTANGASWGGGSIDLLPTTGAWPATLAGGAFTVSTPTPVVSVPGSSLGSVATPNNGTYTASANAFAASAATVPATLYPVS